MTRLRSTRRSQLRRALGLLAAVLILAGLWFWPARRNYYSSRDQVQVRLDVPYRPELPDPKTALDLYLPRSGSARFPIVVFVHGGYWSALDRRWMQPLLGTFGNVGASLARQGIAAAIIGYRQYPSIQRGDDSLADIATAIRFVRDSCKSWGCDELFVVGHSAGGHLVSLLALDERILASHGAATGDVAGFVSIDGIFDLNASLPAFTAEQAAVLRTLFGPDDASLGRYSTSTYARANHPRLLVLDSTDDAAVCRDAFKKFEARMASVGSPARFVELAGLGHNETVVQIGMVGDTVMPTLLAFMRR